MTWATYGVTVWIGSVLATFRRDALPVQARVTYVWLMLISLVPAALFTAAARAMADVWFADALWGRVACALTAGLLGGVWALWFVIPRLGIDAAWLGRLYSPRAHPGFSGGRP
jgi:hypothetical protein